MSPLSNNSKFLLFPSQMPYNPVDEDNVFADVYIKSQALLNVSTQDVERKDDENEVAVLDDLQYATAKQLEFIAVARSVLGQMGMIYDRNIHIVIDYQQSLRLERAAAMQQIAIDDYFGR